MTKFEKGHIVSKEIRDKISKSNTGKIKGIKFSEEHKRKIGQANTGCNNGIWKGKSVGYAALHAWVKRHLPKPKLCVVCNNKPPYDLANISGKYKRDCLDFEWICRSCHMKKENRKKHLGEWSHKHKGLSYFFSSKNERTKSG